MVTGKNNNKYYEGYDGSTKVVFSYSNKKNVMEIWEGYFTDFLEDPDLSGDGWIGFTKDYQQCEGVWNEEMESFALDLDEYLLDLGQYKDGEYDYQETAGMIKDLISYLTEAKNIGVNVMAKVVE